MKKYPTPGGRQQLFLQVVCFPIGRPERNHKTAVAVSIVSDQLLKLGGGLDTGDVFLFCKHEICVRKNRLRYWCLRQTRFPNHRNQSPNSEFRNFTFVGAREEEALLLDAAAHTFSHLTQQRAGRKQILKKKIKCGWERRFGIGFGK